MTKRRVMFAIRRENIGARKATQEIRITCETLREVSLVGAYI